MIDAREILERAGELSLRPDVVEKDYVLGWLLAGIFQHPDLGRTWVFKGGTCLKKVYFETYRFSEDLDFTVEHETDLEPEFLKRCFSDIASWVYDECGIEIPADQIRFEIYTNKRGRLNAEGRIYYRGPLQPRGSLPRVKLDLTADEVIVLEPSTVELHHPYSDGPGEGIRIQCYPYTELLAEKVRALAERGRPRDLYDVVNLYRRDDARASVIHFDQVLRQKCDYKGIAVPDLAAVEVYKEELVGEWENMLGHQLPALPPFEAFWNALPGFFRWIETAEAPPKHEPYPISANEEIIRVAPGALVAAGVPAAGSVETIRFAAANHLCVDLDYVDEQGRYSTRRIEPYSLRRSARGDVLLHAIRADGRGHRTYRVDRIQGARATSQTFVPSYTVELTPTGTQSIPLSAPKVRTSSSRPGRLRVATGPVHIYECSYCRRRFRRKKRAPRLRPHKDKSGYPCPGRTGYWVDTKY